MGMDKPTISMDAKLRAEADRIAASEGVSFSAFVSGAVRDALRRRRAAKALLSVIGDWEAEHGTIPDAEVDAAAKELGLTPTPKKKQRARVTTVAGESIGDARTGLVVRRAKTGKRVSSSAASRKS